MAYRLITSVHRSDRILKSGLFTGNFNILLQPKQLELRQFLSQLAHPLKRFGETLGPKEGNKSAAFTAGGVVADPNSTTLSGGRDGPEEDEEKSSGGRRSGGKNKRQIVFAFGAAGMLGVPLQEITDDDNEKACEKQSVPGDFAQLVIAANSTDPQIQYDTVTTVRKSLPSDPNPLVDTIISSNILPTLVNGLSSPDPALQFEAASTLTIITAGTSEQTQAVVEAGAVPLLIKLLASPHQLLREVAVVALGNIIGDGPELRDYVMNQGVLAPLLKSLQPDTPIPMLRHVALAIASICRYEDAPPPPQTLQKILPALNVLVRHNDTEVLAYTLLALWKLTGSGNEHIQMVIDSGVLPKLVQLLNHPEVVVQMIAFKAVGKIVFFGTGDQVQALLNCDVLSYFHKLLNHPEEEMARDAMCILSVVTLENRPRVQAVIDAGFIPLIIHHLERGEVLTKKAAACAVSGMAVSGNAEQVAHLIDCGVIPPFCNLLNDKDSHLIDVMLHGIQNILMKSVTRGDKARVCTLIEECGGLDKIQTLQDHENKEISMMSCYIIENYFSNDVEEDSGMTPEVAEPIKST